MRYCIGFVPAGTNVDESHHSCVIRLEPHRLADQPSPQIAAAITTGSISLADICMVSIHGRGPLILNHFLPLYAPQPQVSEASDVTTIWGFALSNRISMEVAFH